MATDLIQRARTGELDPVYIIGSAQPLLVGRVVSAILDAAVPPELRGFNHEVIEPRHTTATRIISACQTLPMMAQRRSVLVRDLAVLSAAELDKLKAYIDSPNPSTVLVALTSKLDQRLKFYKYASKKKVVHNPKAPKFVDQWIAGEADHQGVVMERAAARRLADVIGKDLARIALSIDQLALFAGDRAVTADDVDDLIADTRERNVFELIKAIGAGDRAAALAAVASLCEQRQSPVGVVVMLAKHMRSLGLCKVAHERGVRGDGPLCELFDIKPQYAWKIKQFMKESQHYSAVAIGQALAAISHADRELKGQTATIKTMGRELGEQVVLDRLVSDIIGLRQRAARPGQRAGGRQRRGRR